MTWKQWILHPQVYTCFDQQDVALTHQGLLDWHTVNLGFSSEVDSGTVSLVFLYKDVILKAAPLPCTRLEKKEKTQLTFIYVRKWIQINIIIFTHLWFPSWLHCHCHTDNSQHFVAGKQTHQQNKFNNTSIWFPALSFQLTLDLITYMFLIKWNYILKLNKNDKYNKNKK